MIEFDVVDLISSISLESLVYKIVFSICDPQFLIIEDTSESSVGYETTV